jgi:hypothetical protein
MPRGAMAHSNKYLRQPARQQPHDINDSRDSVYHELNGNCCNVSANTDLRLRQLKRELPQRECEQSNLYKRNTHTQAKHT